FEIANNAANAAREALLPARIAVFTAWLELRPPAEGPLVSVILPTRDRPTLLPRALVSVLLQRYERWQLVVVDDGAKSDAKSALADIDDDRITLVKGPRKGLGAARNAGLKKARGAVVCYLDDDNVMHPNWLQAVAYVFAARKDVAVAYGVTLAEHRIPDVLDQQGWWPSLWQLPWSREIALEQNPADAGALAHRRRLKEARFDESLSTGEDWDLLIRLAAKREALAVPALSHAYSLEGEDRMSREASHRAGLEKIRRRHAR
ncbi:MAG TPA: glycosyltransferase, partial [Rhizobiales bacterium]|nr:glycosyltransferase [Hyphomicrobiales bacterium]